jgi:hypothetical protein
MYQIVAPYFALSFSIYQSLKSLQQLDDSIKGNSSTKTIFIDYVLFTSNIYLSFFFLKLIN